MTFSTKKLITSALIATGLMISFSSNLLAKELPPTGSAPSSFTVPETNTVTLSNGLKVTFVPYGATPKVTIRLITNTGNIDDTNKVWLSDISYEMLRQGTKNYSAKQLAEAAANMGGQIQTSVGMDSSWIGMDVLSEFGTDAVSVIADMILNAQFATSDLERIKTDKQRQLQVALSQPGNVANQAFYQAIYGNHPYGQLFPTNESLAGINKSDIEGFIRSNVAPNRSHLYISGVFDQTALTSTIESTFVNWPSADKRQAASVQATSGPKLIMLEREKAPQSTVRLGLATFGPSHEDYIEMTMMNTLLGGAFSSRITSNIREDKGFTYSPRSVVINRVGSGLWYQGADITVESTGAALHEVFKEIALLSKEPPSVEELEGIKNYMAGIFVLRNSSRAAIINQLAFIELHGLSADYLTQYVDKIHNISAEKVSEMAAKYLDSQKMTLVIVGDAEAIEPQLKQLEQLKTYWD